MRTAFLSNRKSTFRRRIKRTFVFSLIALCAFALGDSAFSQPPGPAPDRQENDKDSERGDRGPGRGDREPGRDRGERDANKERGNDERGRRNDREQGNPPKESGNRERQVGFDDAVAAASPTTPVQLNQKDFKQFGVSGVYYKGKCDENTPVVVILRDLDGKIESYNETATLLASQGFAVLIPELRVGAPANNPQPGNDQPGGNRPGGDQPGGNQPGNDQPGGNLPGGNLPGEPGEFGAQNYGASPILAQPQPPQQGGDDRNRNRQLSPAEQLNMNVVSQMINDDYDFWFNMFLKYAHNKKYCNMRKTILVGSGFGAALASAWAKNDWNAKGNVKQNVVGVALLSPDAGDDEGKYNALISLEALHKKAKGAVMGYLIFVGGLKNVKLDDAKEIQRKIGGKVLDEKTPMEERSCPIVNLKTEKQGDDLLRYEAFGVSKTLCQWVAIRMKKLPKKRDKWEEIVEKKSRRD